MSTQVAPDGAAAGYRAHSTLTFGTEFRRQLTRRRTQWTLGLLALLPVVLYIAFTVGGDQARDGGGNGAFALADFGTFGAANFALFALLVTSGFLLIVVVALFCGDTIASEAQWGSLRYLLATPVPRGRLLAVKFTVGLAFSGLAMVVLTAASLLVGFLAYGWEPLVAPLGGEIAAADAVWRVLGVAGYLSVSMLVVASLAFLLSVMTDAPLAAVGGAVLLHIMSNILNAVTALGDLRDLLPTRYAQAWLGLLSEPAQYDDMVRGIVVSLIYASVFTVAAFIRFSRKDVTS
ncbi:ABC-2 type transport system permease protein [Stackebrandtia endophytica]|uniref:ABC-2 type transport system permease protein n=1 Tax=Stackebrandtia endophytica TaxID=1496996 RepID=A0A543AWM4_9ACTN|nr:ABC transporter permease subunit [Stackebrandtia endophytica]TQL76972.1 ABC-2 type transport system permease protein [Stackebrandtia endophytica]